MKRPKCKYTDLACEFNYQDEFGDPLDECFNKGGCIYKIFPDEGEEWNLQKTLRHSPFWTLWGCNGDKKYVVDETILRAIKAWAGDATEPNSGMYNNPESMYNALELIYYLIDEAQDGDVIVSKEKPYTNEPDSWKINQIKPYNSSTSSKNLEETA